MTISNTLNILNENREVDLSASNMASHSNPPQHARFAEEQRLVDDPAVQAALEGLLQPLMSKLLPQHDYSKQPIDVHLSASAEINACFVSEQSFANEVNNPTLIVTSGLLNQVANLDQLAFVIAHELSHFGLERDLGVHRNTVAEEWGSDANAVRLLFDAGFNPNEALALHEKLLTRNEVDQIFSTHGKDENRIFSLKTALSALAIKAHNRFPEPTPIKLNAAEQNLLLNPPYASFIDQLLEKQGSPTDLIKRLDVLLQNSNELDSPTRRADAIQSIKSASFDLKTASERDLEKIHAFADMVGGEFDSSKLYIQTLEISANILRDQSTPYTTAIPIGWMRDLQESFDTLAQASELSSAVAAAEKINKLWEQRVRSPEYSRSDSYLKRACTPPLRSIDVDTEQESWNAICELSLKDTTGQVAQALTVLGVEDTRLYSSYAYKDLDELFVNLKEARVYDQVIPYSVNLQENAPTSSLVIFTADESGKLGTRAEFTYDTRGLRYLDTSYASKSFRFLLRSEKLFQEVESSNSETTKLEYLREIVSILPTGETGISVDLANRAFEVLRQLPPNNDYSSYELASQIGPRLNREDHRPEFLDYLAQAPHPHLTLAQQLEVLHRMNAKEWLLEELRDFNTQDKQDASTLMTLPTIKLLHNVIGIKPPRTLDEACNRASNLPRETFRQRENELLEVLKICEVAATINSSSPNPQAREFKDLFTAIKPRRVSEFGHSNSWRDYAHNSGWFKNVENALRASTLSQQPPIELIKNLKTLEKHQIFVSGSTLRSELWEAAASAIKNESDPAKREQLGLLALAEPRIEAVSVRNSIMTSLIGALEEQWGIDDHSRAYLEQAQRFNEQLQTHKVSAVDRTELKIKLASSIQAQQSVCSILDPGLAINKDNLLAYHATGISAQLIVEAVGKEPSLNNDFIKFLSQECTPKSAENINHTFKDRYDEIQRNFDFTKKRDLENVSPATFASFHENFWDLPAAGRALIIARLLDNTYNAAVKENEQERRYYYNPNNEPLPFEDPASKVFGLVSKQLFGEQDKNSIPYRILEKFMNNCEDSQRHLILAGMLTATKTAAHEQTGQLRLGESLKLLGEGLNDPAIIKMLQAVHSSALTPAEIRQDLKDVKGSGNLPTRRELLQLIDRQVPEAIRTDIEHIGKVLGGGTYWIVTEARLKNGQECALRLLRPFSAERAQTGFERLSNTIGQFEEGIPELERRDRPNAKLLCQIVRNAIEHAQSYIDTETSGLQGAEQYRWAQELYGATTVSVGKNQYTFDIVPWRAYNDTFVLMDKAKGASFNSIAAGALDPESIREQALAYFALELGHLLRGQIFDHDRHGEQVLISKEGNFQLIDTGAMRLEIPSKVEREQVGQFLANVHLAYNRGSDLAQAVGDTMRKFSDQDSLYLVEINRALLALTDFHSHLQSDDFAAAIGAAMKASLIDNDVQRAYIKELALKAPLELLNTAWTYLSGDSRKEISVAINFRGLRDLNQPQLYPSSHKNTSIHELPEGKYVVTTQDN